MKSSAQSRDFARFRSIWVVDFEFCRDPNELPDVVCLAAKDLISGRRVSLWRNQIGAGPPYATGKDDLVVFFSGMEAELGCHLVLGWPLPVNCVDLIVEYRMSCFGVKPPKKSMLEAAADLGIPIKYDFVEKERIRGRIIKGWPFSGAEQDEIQDYNMADVDEELELFLKLCPQAVTPHAVWRGEFIKVVAKAWFRGIPIGSRYRPLATNPDLRVALREGIITDLRQDFPFYDNDLVLHGSALAEWLSAHSLPVPRTPTRRVSTSEASLSRLARECVELAPFIEGHRTLGQLKEFSLPIGADDRLRVWFAPFWTSTSRSSPPTNSYIYNLPAWMRAIMDAPPGWALAYFDYSGMEFGIAAALSRCHAMMEYYETGEPYLATATAFGEPIPKGATKQQFPREREMFKTGLLACLYGIGEETLARRLRKPTSCARHFLKNHRRVFKEYWDWSDAMVSTAIHNGRIVSRHGWALTVQPHKKQDDSWGHDIRSLRNWITQTMGADITRCACIYADCLGVEILATAHDGILIQVPLEQLGKAIADTERCMKLAASMLLDGFVLRVGSPEVRQHGEQFIEHRGKRTLAKVNEFLERFA